MSTYYERTNTATHNRHCDLVLYCHSDPNSESPWHSTRNHTGSIRVAESIHNMPGLKTERLIGPRDLQRRREVTQLLRS